MITPKIAVKMLLLTGDLVFAGRASDEWPG